MVVNNLVRGQITSTEAVWVWPLRFLFSNNTSNWKIRLFTKPVSKTATKFFFPYSCFTAFFCSSLKVILRPLSSNSSKISFKICSNLASLSLSSASAILIFSLKWLPKHLDQSESRFKQWLKTMAIFRSPANEKDENHNGFGAGASFSLLPRAARFSRAQFSPLLSPF